MAPPEPEGEVATASAESAEPVVSVVDNNRLVTLLTFCSLKTYAFTLESCSAAASEKVTGSTT